MSKTTVGLDGVDKVFIIAGFLIVILCASMMFVGAVSFFSRVKYCNSKGVPIGVCDRFLNEEFATKNVKIRLKDEK